MPGLVTEALLGEAANTVSSSFTDAISNFRNIEDPTGLGQSEYNFTSRVFPEDLGNDLYGHYMIININVPVNASGQIRSSYLNVTGPTRSVFTTTSAGQNEYSKVDNLRFNSSATGIRGASPDFQSRELYALKRGTRRIKESIALYMPTPLVFTHHNQYEEISMTSIMGQVGKLGAMFVGAAAQGAIAAFTAAARRRITASRGLFDAAGKALGTASALAGYPINPRIEVLFSTTAQRQFVFEILMAPRNENESRAIKGIIETLRFHSAPEIASLLGVVPTFVPPAEFDLTFYKHGKENTHIPRINTCVMERVEVDYAPTGVYSTFRNGHPVAVRLSMAFRELEIIHKQRVVQGF